MSQFSTLSARDLVQQALRECGATGLGQTPNAEDISDGFFRLNVMMSQWARKRWLCYRTFDAKVVCTGATSYTIGPSGVISTDADGNPILNRPARLEAGFFRQITQSQPNQIDYPIELLQSREDYNRIALKEMQSFSMYCFYDPTWPNGTIYFWPVPQASIYEIHVSIAQQMNQFDNLSDNVNLPYEYYAALMYNLALRLRSKYSIPSFVGDPLAKLAQESLEVLRGVNTAIARLTMPADLNRNSIYNIYSDQTR